MFKANHEKTLHFCKNNPQYKEYLNYLHVQENTDDIDQSFSLSNS
jgi:hypothetical protein